MDAAVLSRDDLKRQFLDLLTSLEPQKATELAPQLFETLRGENDKDLLQAVADKLQIDPAITTIYLRCPELIGPMERLRRGEPVRRVRVALALSPDGRRWFHALQVFGVLCRNGGAISQSYLARWLSYRCVAPELQSALDYLRQGQLVETVRVPGKDPLRPVTWHKITLSLAALIGLNPGHDFLALSQPAPLASWVRRGLAQSPIPHGS